MPAAQLLYIANGVVRDGFFKAAEVSIIRTRHHSLAIRGSSCRVYKPFAHFRRLPPPSLRVPVQE